MDSFFPFSFEEDEVHLPNFSYGTFQSSPFIQDTSFQAITSEEDEGDASYDGYLDAGSRVVPLTLGCPMVP